MESLSFWQKSCWIHHFYFGRGWFIQRHGMWFENLPQENLRLIMLLHKNSPNFGKRSQTWFKMSLQRSTKHYVLYTRVNTHCKRGHLDTKCILFKFGSNWKNKEATTSGWRTNSLMKKMHEVWLLTRNEEGRYLRRIVFIIEIVRQLYVQ